MRKLFSTLNLLLCLELIVGPMAPQLSLLSSVAYAEGCGPGLSMDPILNRCLTSAQNAKIINKTSSCPQGDVKCYRDNAENALKEKEADGDVKKSVAHKKGFVSTVMNAAAVAVPLTLAIGGLKNSSNSCTSISYWAMIAGGVSLFVGDMLANMQHKKRIKSIEKDWKNIVKPDALTEEDRDNQKSNATEAQSQAFEMLARAEDSMEKAAKMKSTFYGISMAAFATATALSILEATNPWGLATSNCPENKANIQDNNYNMHNNYDNNVNIQKLESFDDKVSNIYSKDSYAEIFNLNIKNQMAYNILHAETMVDLYALTKEADGNGMSPSFEGYEKSKIQLANIEIESEVFTMIKTFSIGLLNELSPIKPAHANSLASGVGGVAAGLAFKNQIGSLMASPWGRAGVGGVLFGWSTIMHNHAKSQASASKNRSKQLRIMRDEFKSVSGAINSCKSEDRQDPSKVSCYCYTSDNQRNPNRGNSDVCKKLWATSNLDAGNYFGSSDNRILGCISGDRQFDETCQCKANNSCMKASQGDFSGLSPGMMKMATTGLAPVAQLSTGNFDTASTTAANIGSNAMKIMDAAKKLEAKADPSFKKKSLGAADAFKKSGFSASAGMPSNLLGSSSSPLPSSAAEAATMLEKDLKETAPVGISGKDTVSTPSNSGGMELDFGLTGDQLAAQETQIAEVMKEDLDYGGNDINQGSKTNIFDVLSIRYQRSGLRRLFDEKGTTEAEKPAKTDITQ